MDLVLKDKQYSIGLRFAWNGLKTVVKTEKNFQFHLIATALVIIIGVVCRLNGVEWSIIFLAIGLVLVAEMINTVVEKMIDYIKPDLHPQAGVIKDMAAGAVLVAALIAIIIGFLVYLPKIYTLVT